jgi:predicted RNase H-like nuclease (RuvC/YqgF family)
VASSSCSRGDPDGRGLSRHNGSEHECRGQYVRTIDDAGRYEVRYNDLLAPMVKAIQELKHENDALKSEVLTMKKSNERLAELERFVQAREACF